MKKEVVLITGANGLVAKRFFELFSDVYYIRFLTRKKRNSNEFEWNADKGFVDKNAFKNVDHIVHLAGAGIAEKRWTDSRKKVIVSSRVDSAELILNTLKKRNIKISSFISASAIGYYGTETTDIIYTEKSRKGSDFLSDVCYKWEKAAEQFKISGISDRVVIFRFGIVFSRNGGALKKMVLPIKFFIGTFLGSGDQYVPWIHIDDLCSMIKYSVENSKLTGIFNAVSPKHITNKDLTVELANHYKRPIFPLNIPSFVIKLMFGESAILLLKGSRVSSEKIINEGFEFKYSNLKNALQKLLRHE